MTKPPKIAVLGYYGFGNLGDEAVLAGIVQSVHETVPTGEITVLSNNPAETLRLHPAVTASINRWQWRDVWAGLKNTDVFILGGGSLLQDTTSSRSVVWYALMALLARRRARRVVWWGQGIGPLQSSVSRRMVKVIANQADALTVRDMASAELLKAVGVRKVIQVVADSAFALSPSPTFPATPSTLLCLRQWRSRGVNRAIKEVGLWDAADVLAVPMHLPGDADYMAQGAFSVPVFDWQAQNASPADVMALFTQSPLVVAMRLHALIFAARCAVPFVALSYDPKVDALAQASGQSDALLAVDGITANALREKIALVRDTQTERRAVLAEFATLQGQKARLPAAIVADLL